MGERINRHNDEKLYQPRIHSDLIHEIHKVREITGIPMTVIVDHSIREYLKKEMGTGYEEARQDL
jgi:hypothetical protein